MIKYFKLINPLWVLLCALNMICMLFCYITNPIVVLFADDKGNLPKVFKLWQTYDNCLDIDWMIYEDGNIPNIFKYNFSKYYMYTPEHKTDWVMKPGYVTLRGDNILNEMTTAEKVKRYFCRLAWLMRNCGYGFAYYIFGVVVNPKDLVVLHESDHLFVAVVPNTHIFSIKGTKVWTIFGYSFMLDIYLGYKLSGVQRYKHEHRAMIANRISPFRSPNY